MLSALKGEALITLRREKKKYFRQQIGEGLTKSVSLRKNASGKPCVGEEKKKRRPSALNDARREKCS